MTPFISDVIGMTGTALVVVAYVLLQMQKLSATSFVFNVMNLLGALLLMISLYFNFNLASMVIEVFWIGASLLGLYRYFSSREQ